MMEILRRTLKVRKQLGASSIEYALTLVVIVTIVIAATKFMDKPLQDTFVCAITKVSSFVTGNEAKCGDNSNTKYIADTTPNKKPPTKPEGQQCDLTTFLHEAPNILNLLIQSAYAQITDATEKKTGDKIGDAAEGQLGNEDWNKGNEKDDYPKGKNKCNKFVADILIDLGLKVPVNQSMGCTFPGSLIRDCRKYPPVAEDWADPNKEITCWDVVDKPRRGDIISEKIDYWDATGHVAIVTAVQYDKDGNIMKDDEGNYLGITVGTCGEERDRNDNITQREEICDSNYGFRKPQINPRIKGEHKKAVFRRYTCD